MQNFQEKPWVEPCFEFFLAGGFMLVFWLCDSKWRDSIRCPKTQNKTPKETKEKRKGKKTENTHHINQKKAKFGAEVSRSLSH